MANSPFQVRHGLVVNNTVLVANTTTGNVGIGTSNPQYTLDVAGDARITGNLTLGDSSTDTVTVNAANFSLANNVSFDSGTLFIDAQNNRVGVGITNPQHSLSVNGSIHLTTGDGDRIWSGSNNLRLGSYPQLQVSDTLLILGGQQSISFGGTGAYATIASNVPWDFVKGTTPQGIRIYGTFTNVSNYERLNISAGSTAAYIQTENAGTGVARPLYLGANNATAVTIDTAGRVGIGTDTPSYPLQVAKNVGDAIQVSFYDGTGGGNRRIEFNPYSNRITAGVGGSYYTSLNFMLRGFYVTDDNTGNQVFNVNNGVARVNEIDSGGVAGVAYSPLTLFSNFYPANTTAPAIYLSTFNTAGGAISRMHIYNGDSGKIVLQPTAGNVGIGTSSPAAKLDVAGSFKFANNNVTFSENGVETTNDVGSLTWNNNAGFKVKSSSTTDSPHLTFQNANTNGRMYLTNTGQGTADSGTMVFSVANYDLLYLRKGDNRPGSAIFGGLSADMTYNDASLLSRGRWDGAPAAIFAKRTSSTSTDIIKVTDEALTTTYFNVSNTGNVGIATTSVYNKFQIGRYPLNILGAGYSNPTGIENARASINEGGLYITSKVNDVSSAGLTLAVIRNGNVFDGSSYIDWIYSPSGSGQSDTRTSRIKGGQINAYGSVVGWGYLGFETAGPGGASSTERMRIDANGNIGIGTSSPTAKLDIVAGTSTSNTASLLNLTQTWNNSGNTFTAIKTNITNTASASDSKLIDLQVGGNTKFSVLSSLGGRTVLNGPNIYFYGYDDPSFAGFNSRISHVSNETIAFVPYNTFIMAMSAVDFNPNAQINKDKSFGWSDTTGISTTGDIRLWRDAAGILAQRNSTSGQTYRVYGTYTDSSNHERLSISANTTGHYIIGEEAGTGLGRPLYLGANNATVVTIAPSGNVGIGTTSPNTALDVNGDLTVANIYFRNTGTEQHYIYGNGTSRSIKLPGTGGNSDWVFNNMGGYGIAIYESEAARTAISLRPNTIIMYGGTNYGGGIIDASTANITFGAVDAARGDEVGRNAVFKAGKGGFVGAGYAGGSVYIEAGEGGQAGVSNGNIILASLRGKVGIGTTTPTALLDANTDIIRIRTSKTPASATATGNQGDICWDSNYIYVCTAANTWVRANLSTW